MATKSRFFDQNLYYHIYNCGIEKRTIFTNLRDYSRFIDTILYYLYQQKISFAQYNDLNFQTQKAYDKLNPKGLTSLRVSIIAYCLMPNHFHFLIKPIHKNGITRFISDIINSYTKYFNIKNNRIGVLLQGTFKAKEIKDDESLLQVSRYIHLNPIMSSKTNPGLDLKPEEYPYSSYKEWVHLNPPGLTIPGLTILNQQDVLEWVRFAGGQDKYKVFVESKIGREPKIGIEDLILED